MAQSREKQILGALLQDRTLIEKCDIDRSFFKTEKQRIIFNELQEGAADINVVTQRIREKFPKFEDVYIYITDCTEGVHRMTQAGLQQMINDEKKSRLSLEIANELKKTIIDHEKIRDIYFQIDNLKSIDDDNNWIGLNTVEPRAIEWLWWNRIPAGSLTLIVGDPGDGKSMLAIYLCAQITRGNPLPDKHGIDQKGSILYYSAEDVLADTIRVRAEDAGADLPKLIINPGDKKSGGFVSIQNDIKSLENKIIEIKDVRAIFFDPITGFMGDIESNKVTAVRAALGPLTRLAEKHRIPIIGISHLNKDAAKKAIYRTLGSIAFVAAARTVWLVQRDEDDLKRERRFFAPLKYNVCKNPTTLAFTISGPIGRPKVEFEPDPVDMTSDELLADEEGKERHSAIAEAKNFLLEMLKNGKMPSSEIEEQAKQMNIAQRTLARAKSKLRIKAFKESGQWWSELP